MTSDVLSQFFLRGYLSTVCLITCPNTFLTQRRGSSPAVFSASGSGTATSQMPTPNYPYHPPQPLRPAAACPLLPPILEQEEVDSLPPNGAPISGRPRRDHHPAYLIQVSNCHQNVTEHSTASGHRISHKVYTCSHNTGTVSPYM